MSNENVQARYSLLIAAGEVNEESVRNALTSGLKLILFTGEKCRLNFESKFNQFLKAHFLDLYSNPGNIECVIPDGKVEEKNILKQLEARDNRFNLEQYEIEHDDVDRNMIVVAGAGTGKTHVMINRIMFLMHMDRDFDFSKVAMITFTNKATDNMRHRLIDTLESKYRLTRKMEYLDRIEELSQISISTIHSFFKEVIVEIGPTLGYGTNIQLRSFIKEKKELLRNLLDKQYRQFSGSERVDDAIGLSIHEVEKLAMEYWEKLDNNGISEDVMQTLEWIEPSSAAAKKIQDTLQAIFTNVDQEYNQIKYINNAISMKDIIHELSRVMDRPELKDYISHNYQYMFCDEFQDSDNVQIQTIAVLNRLYGGRLFVVGDIKQSIYRFRGATDSAFSKLKMFLDDNEKKRLAVKSLTKNYRTSKTVLDRLDGIFEQWGPSGLDLLQYEDSLEHQDRLVPQNMSPGKYMQIPVGKSTREKKVMEMIKKVQGQPAQNRITCLTRKNSQLMVIKNWCEKEKIVCRVREKGAFFKSPAVLDFCALLEALVYDHEPMFLYNYILSAYGQGNVDYPRLARCDGDKGKILRELSGHIGTERWDAYRHQLKYKPVMSVLRNIVIELDPVKTYGIRRTAELRSKKYPADKAYDQAVVDAFQYEADLKKLLQMLSDQFAGDFSSLGDICDYVRLKVMTDKNEEVAETGEIRDVNYVEGMTVHGAKGLEFENVFLPFLNDMFYQGFRSEILVDSASKKVGWVYRKKKDWNQDEEQKEIKNDQYDQLIKEEKREVNREETRLLYVAMTRTKFGLYCFPERKGAYGGEPRSWADLLPKEYDDAGSN